MVARPLPSVMPRGVGSLSDSACQPMLPLLLLDLSGVAGAAGLLLRFRVVLDPAVPLLEPS
jgi:hypothetical protein